MAKKFPGVVRHELKVAAVATVPGTDLLEPAWCRFPKYLKPSIPIPAFWLFIALNIAFFIGRSYWPFGDAHQSNLNSLGECKSTSSLFDLHLPKLCMQKQCCHSI